MEEVAGLVRSPSWPPMTVDVADEMTRVARPKSVRKAVVVATLCFLNNVAIFFLSVFLLRAYLQVESAESFGPGLHVIGHLAADSIAVTVEEVCMLPTICCFFVIPCLSVDMRF